MSALQPFWRWRTSHLAGFIGKKLAGDIELNSNLNSYNNAAKRGLKPAQSSRTKEKDLPNLGRSFSFVLFSAAEAADLKLIVFLPAEAADPKLIVFLPQKRQILN